MYLLVTAKFYGSVDVMLLNYSCCINVCIEVYNIKLVKML